MSHVYEYLMMFSSERDQKSFVRVSWEKNFFEEISFFKDQSDSIWFYMI